MPRVTIAIPTYNRASFLLETISALQAGGYTDFRVIIVDDGSTDDTRDVLAPLLASDPRLSYVFQANAGEAAAVNRAWRDADTEYFAVVSSDDPMKPDWLEKAVPFLDARPDCIVGYPDWDTIDRDSVPVLRYQVYEYARERLVSWAWCLPGPGTLIRRAALRDLADLRSRKYRYVSDFECWLRLSSRGEFVRIPYVLANWRQHEGAATVAASGRIKAQEFIGVVREFFRSADLPPRIRKLRRFAMSRAYAHAANCQWRSEPRRALVFNLLSHIVSPSDPPGLPGELRRVSIREAVDRGGPAWVKRIFRMAGRHP